MRSALAAVSVLLACAAPARAEQTAALADRAEAASDAESLIASSRALLSRCLRDLRAPACEDWLNQSEQEASRALTLTPDSIEPRLNLALTLGMKGRRAGVGEALSRRYASRGKALIEETLALSPNEARAYALLGGWNLEILRRGGPVGARLMGASAKAGLRAFDKAVALSPASPAIALNYAVALLALNPQRYGEKARDLLLAASVAPAGDAFDAVAVEESRRIGAVMATRGAVAAAETAAATFLLARAAY